MDSEDMVVFHANSPSNKNTHDGTDDNNNHPESKKPRTARQETASITANMAQMVPNFGDLTPQNEQNVQLLSQQLELEKEEHEQVMFKHQKEIEEQQLKINNSNLQKYERLRSIISCVQNDIAITSGEAKERLEAHLEKLIEQ